jgi:hypothetical protein
MCFLTINFFLEFKFFLLKLINDFVMEVMSHKNLLLLKFEVSIKPLQHGLVANLLKVFEVVRLVMLKEDTELSDFVFKLFHASSMAALRFLVGGKQKHDMLKFLEKQLKDWVVIHLNFSKRLRYH